MSLSAPLPARPPRMVPAAALGTAAVLLITFLTSCGPQPVSTPPPRSQNSASAEGSSFSIGGAASTLLPETAPAGSPPAVPGFEILSDGRSLSLPPGPVLAANWEAVRRHILARPAGSLRDGMMAMSISALAATDPALARQALADWKNAIPSEWVKAANAVAQALWAQDPDSALDFIGREIPASWQGGIWPVLLGGMAPEQAAARLDLTRPNTAKLRAAATILTNWTAYDPPAAAAWLDQLGTILSPDELKIVAAPKYFVSLRSGPPKLSVLEASRQALEAARHPAARKIFADDYLRAAAKEQPDRLAEITAEVEARLASPDAAELRREAALAQLRENPPAWFAVLTEEEIRSLSPGFLREAVQAWMQKDTPAATRWALARGLTDQVESGVGRWYSMDPPAAREFVSSMTAGESRDRGMLELCGRLSLDRNFEEAEKCLEEIADPKLRKQAAVRLESGKERARRQ